MCETSNIVNVIDHIEKRMTLSFDGIKSRRRGEFTTAETNFDPKMPRSLRASHLASQAPDNRRHGGIQDGEIRPRDTVHYANGAMQHLMKWTQEFDIEYPPFRSRILEIVNGVRRQEGMPLIEPR